MDPNSNSKHLDAKSSTGADLANMPKEDVMANNALDVGDGGTAGKAAKAIGGADADVT